jgi:hypothetical protein
MQTSINKVEKVTSWEICEGHTITKTLTESMGAYTTQPYKYSAWDTHITCSCGWTSGHNSKLSNKVITQVHNECFNIVLEVK